jgi:hypothetical protein
MHTKGYGGSIGWRSVNVGPGFDQQDVKGPILGHPTGHNAARRTGANDNVGELVGLHENTAIMVLFSPALWGLWGL